MNTHSATHGASNSRVRDTRKEQRAGVGPCPGCEKPAAPASAQPLPAWVVRRQRYGIATRETLASPERPLQGRRGPESCATILATQDGPWPAAAGASAAEGGGNFPQQG
ncbi:hypothetical protein EWB00_000719, partial [Schistosoma japonicum]